LAHVARAETGRVWLYFTPVAVAIAAIVIADRGDAVKLAVLGLLGLHLVVQGSLFRTHEYGFMPETLPAASVPADATTVDARFGASGQIALLAYRLSELKPGQDGQITLYWQRMSDEPIDAAYKAFVHVATDEIVEDAHRLAVSADARSGEYPVFVGLYDPVKSQRPPTFASPPAQQMHGSVLLPTRVMVK
jgi:hypothetical protein